MVCNKKKRKFIKRKWNHVIFSRATILSFRPVYATDVCRSLRTLADRFLNPGDNLGCSDYIRKPRRWRTCCPTSVVSFKVLVLLKNLTFVWKYVEIEHPSLSCLNNLERYGFVICLHTKDLLFCPIHDFAIFSSEYQVVNYFPAIF